MDLTDEQTENFNGAACQTLELNLLTFKAKVFLVVTGTLRLPQNTQEAEAEAEARATPTSISVKTTTTTTQLLILTTKHKTHYFIMTQMPKTLKKKKKEVANLSLKW